MMLQREPVSISAYHACDLAMIKAIIIDDEKDGREGLRFAIKRYCPDVELIQVCATPEEGIDAINTLHPDLLFLDVEMPRLSGFDVLQRVANVSFAVIFVSAYDKYAIKAIRFSALDYLLKPVDADELVQAVRRVMNSPINAGRPHFYQSMLHNIQHAGKPIGRLAVPSAEGIDFLNTDEVIFCHAEGSYTQVYLSQGRKQLISKNLLEFENILSDSGFCRVHHSSLINMRHVQKYIRGEGGYVLLTDGHQVNISRRRREEFISMLDKV
jgi:two-component system LytT family response regulator